MWRFTAIFWKYYLPPKSLPPKSLPPKNEKPPTAKTLPPYCITAEKTTAIFWFYRFRRRRYRQKRENGQPPRNYRRVAIPPRLCPPKTPLPTTTPEIFHACLMCPCRARYENKKKALEMWDPVRPQYPKKIPKTPIPGGKKKKIVTGSLKTFAKIQGLPHKRRGHWTRKKSGGR